MTDSVHGSRGGARASAVASPAGRGAGRYVRALAAAVGRPALSRGLPLYLGLAAPAGVIFGPNGMHPAELADAAAASPGVRLALWGGWVLAALPVAHALFDGERTAYLRWLAAPRAWTWAALAAMLLGVHALFGFFWSVARGPLAAAGAMSLAAAVQATLLLAPRHRGEAVARALALGSFAALVAAGLGSAVWLAAGLAGLIVAVPAAWTRCVEHGPRRARALRTRRASLVLAQLYLRGLWRTRPGLVTRTLLTTALGAGLVVLSSRGLVEIAGASLTRAPVAARQKLGYVPEAANPPGHMTGEELFALVQALKQAPPLAPARRTALGVDAIAAERIARLSLGQRRRVCLGAALIGDPAVLVLDEPTNGLDRAGVATLIALLEEQRDASAIIVVATHDRDLAAALAGQHFQMQAGRLAPGAGLPEDSRDHREPGQVVEVQAVGASLLGSVEG